MILLSNTKQQCTELETEAIRPSRARVEHRKRAKLDIVVAVVVVVVVVVVYVVVVVVVIVVATRLTRLGI